MQEQALLTRLTSYVVGSQAGYGAPLSRLAAGVEDGVARLVTVKVEEAVRSSTISAAKEVKTLVLATAGEVGGFKANVEPGTVTFGCMKLEQKVLALDGSWKSRSFCTRSSPSHIRAEVARCRPAGASSI